MESSRVAALVAIAASLLVVGVVLAPYGLVRTAPGATVGQYYGAGAFNPLITGLFAFVLAMVLTAGLQRRTDPAMAAGVGLALGTLVFLVIAFWALTVPQDVVYGMDAPQVMADHRWILTASALVPPVASLAWAYLLGIF